VSSGVNVVNDVTQSRSGK